MALGSLRFASRSLVPGHPAEVFDLLADAEALPRWWPATHALAHVLARGEADGTGRCVELESRLAGGLRLSWRWSVVRGERPHACTFALDGDVRGTLAWTLRQEGPYVVVDAEWRLQPQGALRTALAPLLAPLLALAYRRAVRAGELALRIELRRRHAVTAHERAMIPPPPGGSWDALAGHAQGALAAVSDREPDSPAA